MENEPSQRIGDYEVLGVLGAGGMGKVYRVRNVLSDRIEAMKILLPSLSAHQDVGDRFLREIKLVASLQHPNIANLCTAQTIDNNLVMVMEFVDGDTFSDLLDHRAVPLKHALNYFDQALAALSYAHGKGIVHRDIKPSNIMLTPEGLVKLMDFGIARCQTDRSLTQTGATIGTVSYMSPEQIAGKSTDGRSDLYSVGIFMYETMTGEQPFKGTSDYELMAAHMNQTPRAPVEVVPGIPDGLNHIVLKLLAKAPEDRYQTAEEVRAALRGLSEYDGVVRVLPRVVAPTMPMPARPATVVEGLTIPGPSRMATLIEPGRGSTMVKDAYSGRRMTEVAGMPAYSAPSSSALVARKKGLAKNPVLYVGGGLALVASAIAVPVMMHRDKVSDPVGKMESAAPFVTSPAANAPKTPGAGGSGAPAVPGRTPGGPPEMPPGRGPRDAMGGGVGATPAGLSKATLSGNGRPSPGQAGVTGGQTGLTAGISGTAGGAAGTPPLAPPAPTMSPELKAKLDEEELHIDQLGSRSVSINNSLNTMQRSLQKDGVNLRGDITSKQASMNNNLGKAKQALAAHDADRASKFAAMADIEEGELEGFLGR